MKYYISDLHFGDERVFKKAQRNQIFINTEEVNKTIIERWNSVVTDDDEVYLIGDISEDLYEEGIDLLQKMKGTKYLIVGNHDYKLLDAYISSGIFKDVKENMLINDNGRKVHLCHYPLMDWMEFNRGGYLIYGHIHNKNLPQIKEYYRDKLAFNVGCDVLDYTPKTLDQLIELKEENKNESYIN